MGLFGKKPTELATLNLNARLQPMHRDSYYEKTLKKLFKKAELGVIDGGGTLFTKDEGPLECDINIMYYAEKEAAMIEIFKMLPAPKGSKLILEGNGENEDTRTIEIGNLEGLAVYLNGTELDDEVYKSCDVNFVIAELRKLLGDKFGFFSHWTGNKETALYFYGTEYEAMKSAIEPFLSEYPLCQKCRVVKIA